MFTVVLGLLFLIKLGQTNDVLKWHKGSSLLGFNTDCMVFGYNNDTKYGYFITNDNVRKIFKCELRASLNGIMSIKNITKIYESNIQAYSCQTKSTQINNRIYFMNKDTRMSMFDMDKEIYYENYINQTVNVNSKVCLAADYINENIYMVDGQKFYYYSFKMDIWIKGHNLEYNYLEFSCAYANNRFYIFGGSSALTIEYIDTDDDISNNGFNLLKTGLNEPLRNS